MSYNLFLSNNLCYGKATIGDNIFNRKCIMTERKSEYSVLPVIINRWSPRAMSGEALTEQELMPLFEAARWAASSYNNQPWRFIYALRNTPQWQPLFDIIMPGNQEWAKNAGALILVLSHNLFDYNGKPSRTHSLDTGFATANLALQGTSDGLVVHGIEGFDYENARKNFNIPADYTVEAMYIIGKPAPKETLPLNLRQKEVKSDRKKISDFVYNGSFGKQS
jgi:nitroreductase